LKLWKSEEALVGLIVGLILVLVFVGGGLLIIWWIISNIINIATAILLIGIAILTAGAGAILIKKALKKGGK